MKKHFYINLILLAIMLLSVPGTVLAQASYDDFCKPTVTGHPNGSKGNKRWQTNGEITSPTGLHANSPTSFSPIGNKENQSWANTDNEIIAYAGATFNLKIQYGIENNDYGWGTSTIFRLRSDAEGNEMLGQYLGDWGVQNGNNLFTSIQNAKESSNGFIVDVNNTERSATFKIDIPEDIAAGELVVFRFIICKKYDAANENTPIGSCTEKYDDTPCATNAIELNYCDYIVRIVEDMAARTVTVSSAGNGTAEITNPQGAVNGSINTNLPVTVRATPATGYKFKNWTNADNRQEISTSNPFTYTGKGAASLIANFEKEIYPEMKHFFFNDGLNKYLRGADYTLDGSSYTRIHYANTAAEIPFTDYNGTLVNSSASRATMIEQATAEGAQLDWTDNKIVIPEGKTSFTMKFYGWTENIYSARHNKDIAAALNWTEQAIYIDWNNDGNFSGSNELYAPLHSAAGNNNFGGNIATGWTREFNIPDGQPSGTYRMRVIHAEPNGAWGSSKTWNTILFTDLQGVIQNGYAYDFDIVIGTVRTITISAGNGGTVSFISPSEQGNSVETAGAVTVEATADEGYRFVNWTNGTTNEEVSTLKTYTYEGTEDITLVANFAEMVSSSTVTWEQPANGSVTVKYNGNELSSGEKVEDGSEIEIIPTANAGYETVSVAANGTAITDTEIQTINGKEVTVYKTIINGNTTITVDIDPIQYIISWDNSTAMNGEITVQDITGTTPVSVSTGSSLPYGTILKITPTAENGYKPSRVYYKYQQEGGTEIEINEGNQGYVLNVGPDQNSTSTSIFIFAEFNEITNRYAQTIASADATGSTGIVRIELDDKILGSWDSSTDNRSSALTMEAWVNFESSPYSGFSTYLMGHGQGHYIGSGYTPSFGVIIANSGDRKMAVLSRARNGIGSYPAGVEQVSDDKLADIPQGWFHLALTASLDTKADQVTYKLYVNGEEQTNAGITVTGNTYGNLPYLPDNANNFGCVLSFGGNMNCKFDDIMIWTRTLDAKEIKESMKGYSTEELGSMQSDGLVGYYLCDDMQQNNGIDGNIVTPSDFDLKLLKLTGSGSIGTNNFITVNNKTAPADISGYTQNSERTTPRGGEKLFVGEDEATWQTNGNETEFGYIFNTGNNMKRLAYNGVNKIDLPEGTLAVYHNGDPGLPVYVNENDIMTNAEIDETAIRKSYVAAGIEYTMTMPTVAKQWMPVSFPEQVDLVAGPSSSNENNIVGLRPGYNFWYSTFNSGYTDETGYSDIWTDFKKVEGEDSKTYLLDAGIISVPESRKGQQFTFYTRYNVPVVMRAWNDAFNATLMPAPGKLGLVKNPYSFNVNVTDAASQIGQNMTVYVFNPTSGNFDIPQEGQQFTIGRFTPFFVFNGNGTTQQAPRYIGTKDVSGVLETEAVYDVNIRGAEGAVEVETFVPAKVEIFTVGGTMVADAEVEGTRSFALEAGIYVVRTVAEGNIETVKVIVE